MSGRHSTKLRLETIEGRCNPAPVYVASGAYSEPPIQGWTGQVQEADADYLGRSTPTAHDTQRAFVAGVDGGIRVVIKADSPPGTPFVQVATDEAGNPIFGPPVQDAVVFDHVFFDPAHDRMGGQIAAVYDPTAGHDVLAVATLAGGGPVVALYDVVAGTDQDVLVGDPNYRGGIDLTATVVHLDVPAGPDPFAATALIVTPAEGGGGGPVLTAYTAGGDVVTSFLIGPAADRSGLYQPASAELNVDVAGFGHRGLGVRGPDGTVTLYDWTGVTHALTFVVQ